MWFLILVAIAGMTLLGILSVLATGRTHISFLAGFNTMALVTAIYTWYGLLNLRSILVLVMVGIYLLRMNWVLTRWTANTALDKLDKTSLAHKILLPVVLTNTVGWAYCLPFFFATRDPSPVGGRDMVAIAIYIVGTIFHSGGDYQKQKFKADPASKGKILDTGLWSLCRHPNYFGDFLIYVSFAVIGGQAWGWIAPMLNLLQYVSDAIPKSEKWAAKKYGPAWKEYRARTRVFVPFII
jgi:steroid 5-alpha reductase family enzyme